MGNPVSGGMGLAWGVNRGLLNPAHSHSLLQPRRLLCKELFTWGWGSVPSPWHATALTWPHAAKIWGARGVLWDQGGGRPAWGDVALPPAEPDAGRRGWPGALTADPTSPTVQAEALSPKSALLVPGQAAGRGGMGAQHSVLGHGADAPCLPGPGELPSQHFPGV